MSYNKYRAKKTEVDGKMFDSKREAGRYMELRLMERAGIIRNLRTQVEYVCIPPQRNKEGKILEHAVKYRADFVYEELTPDKWDTVVEDAKGCRTPEYIIKRKLMLLIFNIRIREV